MENNNRNDAANPQADRHGVRHFGAQSVLDAKGIQLLQSWFQEVLPADVTPIHKYEVQLRGLDLSVKLKRRGAKGVGIDLKADNKDSGNISIELISQDRPNSQRSEPAPGWTAKDMPMVAQFFMKTGEMVVMNMPLFYPWLFEQLKGIVEGRAKRFAFTSCFLSATPNKAYNTYNIIVPLRVLLAEAPGCLYIRACDVLSEAKFAKLVPGGTFGPLLMPDYPYDATAALAVLEGWLGELGNYDVKPQLSAVEKERLLRYLEPLAKFSKADPAIREAGLALQANRPRLALPEDAASVVV